MTRPSSLDGVMVFDGVCHLCSGFVRLVLRFDRRGNIRFVPIQSNAGRLLAARNGVDPDDPLTFLFFENGHAFEASDAIVAMLRWFPPPLRYLAILRWIPRPVRDFGYRIVARNRYRLFGRRRTCLVPSAVDRSRFLLEVAAIDGGETPS